MIVSAAGILLFAAAVVVLCIVIGKPLISFLGEPQAFRAWVDGHGVWGRLLFVGMVVVQVVIAFIPGEPFEIAAGYAFGYIEGTLLCVLGTTVGGVLVFLLVRRFGVRAVGTFFSLDKLNSLSFLKDSKKRNILTFLLFLIPGTPKDLLTYFVGLTKIPLGTWIFITSVARLPSIVTSTVGGHALGVERYQFAIIVFAVTLVLSGVGILVYRRIGDRHPAGGEENPVEEKTNVMRTLDQKKIAYRPLYYDGDALSGVQVAECLGLCADRVFKTLVTSAKSGRYYVFMIPAAAELDLKKAASAVREKSVDMLKSKELLPLTGYVHGGCSPIGMKKRFPVVIDASAGQGERVYCSAGRIGAQIDISVTDLVLVTGAAMAELTVSD